MIYCPTDHAEWTRRDFLKTAARLTALMGLTSSCIGPVAQALEGIAEGTTPVLWLQGQSCSGCSVSLLNSYPHTPVRLLTESISLKFHQTLSTATGDVAAKAVEETIAHPGYVLVVEGAVPYGMPEACRFHHETFVDQLRRAANAASAIVTVGACASFGGVPGAEGNPTGAIGVAEFLKREKIKKPLVAVPGCPPHPDWMVGTFVHLVKFGVPELDSLNRPTMFYGRTIHDQCPRFPDYERQNFASFFSEKGCLFKLGCQGPVTYADCTTRKWNSGVNDCIASGAGCTGCAFEQFPRAKNFPFFTVEAAAAGRKEHA